MKKQNTINTNFFIVSHGQKVAVIISFTIKCYVVSRYRLRHGYDGVGCCFVGELATSYELATA